MLRKLVDEADYLESNGITLESLVDAQMSAFETHLKRNKDIYKSPSARIYIPNLRGDKQKRFDDNHVLLNA